MTNFIMAQGSVMEKLSCLISASLFYQCGNLQSEVDGASNLV